MISAFTAIEDLSNEYRTKYKSKNVILSYDQYLELVKAHPLEHLRNSPRYLLDAFEHFGRRSVEESDLIKAARFKIFDLGTERSGPIVGGESVQTDIFNILESFVRGGYASKMILLHGPNGSAKSSSIEAIANAMQLYSESEAGAIYRFNWIFPTDRDATPLSSRDSLPIGFTAPSDGPERKHTSYALLEEHKIASKIKADFKENPIFLLPMPFREELLRKWISDKTGVAEQDVEIPPHILSSSLSKINQQIFENLLHAYDGNLNKVLRHIQIERFFYSKQYRVGISTVEPQMSIDATEKQLTLDKNYSNIPAILHTINFYQAEGSLVEANRGILEFSDLLKRPVESFKYLLSSIEKGTINLPSGTANLDIVYMGTTNEKHLDAFKTIPDFSSFKGRFELITVPYLLLPEQEEQIYASDIKAIRKLKPIAPHTLRMLCTWAVLTRLKQPDPENYPKEYRPLVARLDPRSKLTLYQGKSLQPAFSISEQNSLQEIREQLWGESEGMVVYEGRFGASPREIRAILHRAAQYNGKETITALTVFEELRRITKDRTVYEFLQFEPRAKYHDATLFIDILEVEFLDIFEQEAIQSMSMADEHEYDNLLKRYVEHVVAYLKNEKIWDESTSSYIPPTQAIMKEVEGIIEVKQDVEEHRRSLLSRIAAFKIEHPEQEINIGVVFHDFMAKIKQRHFEEKRKIIEQNFKNMVEVYREQTTNLNSEEVTLAETTFENLSKSHGYDRTSVFQCIQHLLLKRQSNPTKESSSK